MSDLECIYKIIKRVNTDLSWDDFIYKINNIPNYSVYALSLLLENKRMIF